MDGRLRSALATALALALTGVPVLGSEEGTPPTTPARSGFGQFFKKALGEGRARSAGDASAPAASTNPGPEQFTRLFAAGRLELHGLSPAEEAELGRRAAAAALHRLGGKLLPPASQRDLWEYVNAVARVLARQSPRPGLAWRVGVVDAAEARATSAPGGVILVTTGLLGLLRDEAELAGILAHQVAHVSRRHALFAAKRAYDQQLKGRVVGQLLARNLGLSAEVPDRMAGTLGSAARRAPSPREEEEADRLAAQWVYQAGWRPLSLADALRRLGAASPPWRASSSPAPEERAAAVERVIEAGMAGAAGLPTAAERYRRLVLDALE